eukprot:3306558-Prymnesium_polylepis.1
MARNCAFGALASSSRKHCLCAAANFITDVRCRSPAAIVTAHRRSRAATFDLFALQIQVPSNPRPRCAIDAH